MPNDLLIADEESAIPVETFRTITDEVIRESIERSITETTFGELALGNFTTNSLASGGTLTLDALEEMTRTLRSPPPRWPTTHAPRTWDHDYDMMQRRPLWVMDGNDERCRVVLWNIDPHFADRNAIRVVAVHGVSVIEFDVGRDIESLRNEQDGINYIEHEINYRWGRDIGTRCYVKRWHPDWQRDLRLLPEDLGRSRFHIHGDAVVPSMEIVMQGQTPGRIGTPFRVEDRPVGVVTNSRRNGPHDYHVTVRLDASAAIQDIERLRADLERQSPVSMTGGFAEARRRDRTATVIPDHKPNDWEA